MNEIRLRLLRITTLALSAYLGYEGLFYALKGHLVGRVFAPNALPKGDVLLVGLPNGLAIQYPFWAQTWMSFGVDPTILAPVFLGLGALGVIALALMWRQKWFAVWVLLVPFHLMAILHWGIGSAIALLGLIGLFLPGWRIFWFSRTFERQERHEI